MLKVEIYSDFVNHRTLISKTDGRPMNFHEQEGWVHLEGVPFPLKFSISLADGQPAWPKGIYDLHSSSVRVGKYDRLEFCQLRLIPVQNPTKA